MKNNYKVIIVGGGASGLLCAVELLRGKDCLSGNDVCILEQNDRVGKKLLATGNGQCNLSNANLNAKNYHGDTEFINGFLENAKSVDLLDYLTKLGIPLTTNEDGKIYPLSKQATAVLDVLRAYLELKNCTIQTSTRVLGVKKVSDKYVLKTQSCEYTASKVVLAFGGSVGKQFGTDGKSYSLATNLGHAISPLYPSLVQLKTNTEAIKGLKGIKETALVRACDGEKELVRCEGDLLFTDFGVSGSAIFQISGYLATAKNPLLKIEFVPSLSFFDLVKVIELRRGLDYVKEDEILTGIVNKRIGQAVYKTARKKDAQGLATALKDFSLKVTGTLGFNYAQVTKGGVTASGVSSLTYQSKKTNGVYVIGEALNIDGDCGGYNLSFAFVSGIVCARNVKGQLQKA